MQGLPRSGVSQHARDVDQWAVGRRLVLITTTAGRCAPRGTSAPPTVEDVVVVPHHGLGEEAGGWQPTEVSVLVCKGEQHKVRASIDGVIGSGAEHVSCGAPYHPLDAHT